MRTSLFFLLLMTTEAFARSVFLNGKDVSSAVGKKLEGVNISIAENGDVFISAPQYQVLEEVSYVPLGQDRKELPPPQRLEPKPKLGAAELPDQPASNLGESKTGLEEKPGSKSAR